MIGDIVCYRNTWNGVIIDEFTSKETGKKILHVLFIKNIYKRQFYDVLDYKEGMFTPSNLEAMVQEALSFEKYKNDQLQEIGVSLDAE